MTTKKFKFGKYKIEASVTIDDEIDLENYFTKKEWDNKKRHEQEEWLNCEIENLAMADLDISWKYEK